MFEKRPDPTRQTLEAKALAERARVLKWPDSRLTEPHDAAWGLGPGPQGGDGSFPYCDHPQLEGAAV